MLGTPTKDLTVKTYDFSAKFTIMVGWILVWSVVGFACGMFLRARF